MNGGVIALAIAALVGILGGIYLRLDGNGTGTVMIAVGGLFLLLAARQYAASRKG